MKNPELLTRDIFRNSVFERDRHQCVVCGQPAIDAHHIMERRLFGDNGGYFLDNGASMCSKHHIEAEQTTISCDYIREAARIETVILPEHLYEDCTYDKWGNMILSSGLRTKGELFDDISVQKILEQGGVLDSFTDKVKYSRTYHLPWSPGMNRDDRMMKDVSVFNNERVIIFEKLDGENTTMYSDGLHARSLDSSGHPSRDFVKNIWAQKGYNIPKGWRVCGENMYAKHALYYCNEPTTLNLGTHLQPRLETFPGCNALDDYFYVFNIWNDRNRCISWDETKEWIELLEFSTCPIFYDGIWSMDIIEKLNKYVEDNKGAVEGYVVRLAREFHYSEFKIVNGKYVRSGHVQQNHGHWMQNKVIKNELRTDRSKLNIHDFKIII